jgi:hypothetical protein
MLGLLKSSCFTQVLVNGIAALSHVANFASPEAIKEHKTRNQRKDRSGLMQIESNTA